MQIDRILYGFYRNINKPIKYKRLNRFQRVSIIMQMNYKINEVELSFDFFDSYQWKAQKVMGLPATLLKEIKLIKWIK